MSPRDPDLRRTWLFAPGAGAAERATALGSGADLLIDALRTAPGLPRQGPEAARTRLAAVCRAEPRRARTLARAGQGAGLRGGRACGEDQALVDGLSVALPTYRSALRPIDRGWRLAFG